MKRYKARLLPSAYNDIRSARTWYRQHNQNLPRHFKKQVYLCIERIKENPFAYAVRYKEVRIANVTVFPYAIHFLIKEDIVIVIAVHHTAISPERWIDRF